MDGGANGVVAGSDVRVIETHHDLKVDTCGVETHQLLEAQLQLQHVTSH